MVDVPGRRRYVHGPYTERRALRAGGRPPPLRQVTIFRAAAIPRRGLSIRPRTLPEGRMSQLQNLIGSTVAGRYRLEAALGAEGVAHAFRAEDTAAGRPVVVHLVPADAWSADDRARFQAELRTAAAVEHPNLAKVLDFGSDAELKADYVATEVPTGEPLSSLLAQRGAPPAPLALRILQEAAAGLAAAHAAGVAHGEVHPPALLLVRGGADRRTGARVLNLGLRAAHAAGGRLPPSARYAAPEVLRRQPPSPAADVFSLGVVAYEVLAGLPQQWGAMLAGMARNQPVHVPSPAEAKPQVPEDVALVVLRALDPDPAKRYPSAGAFAAALADAAPPVPEPAPRPAAVAPPAPAPVAAAAPEPVAEAPAEPAAPVRAYAPPPPPPTPEPPKQRVAAPGSKVASGAAATDLKDFLYIPPTLEERKARAEAAKQPPVPPAPAVPVEKATAAPPPPPPVVEAVKEQPVSEPTPAPEPPREEPAAVQLVPVAEVVASAPVTAAPAPVAVAATVSALPERRAPRVLAPKPAKPKGLLVAGGVAALLVIAAVGYAALGRGGAAPAEQLAGQAQNRLAANLPAGGAPATAGDTAVAETEAAAPPAADAPKAEETEDPARLAREKERARRDSLQREQRRQEEQRRAQRAADSTQQMRQLMMPLQQQAAAPPPPADTPRQSPPERRVTSQVAAAAPAETEVRASAPRADPNKVYGIGEVDDTPSLTNGTDFQRAVARSYPAALAGTRTDGRASVQFVVLANGRVDPGSVSVLSASNPAFRNPASRVITQARFAPAKVGGTAVKAQVRMSIQWSGN